MRRTPLARPSRATALSQEAIRERGVSPERTSPTNAEILAGPSRAKATAHIPKRNWGAGVATDSPVAGLRSAHHVLRPDRAFWFRRLATPVLSEDGARFRGLLRSDRLATFLPLHRSGRTARKHFFLRGSLHPSDPKVPGISRLLRSDRLATFFPRRRSGRTTRRHFVHRGLLHPAGPKAALVSLRSTRFDPKTHLSFPGRSSGPGAIIRRVSATRPPAAYEDSLPKHPVFAVSPQCPFHFPGCPVR